MSEKKISTAGSGLLAALNKQPKTETGPAHALQADLPKTATDEKGVIFRMTKSDWKRLKEIAHERETTLQQLIEDGINRLLADRGLPAIGANRNKAKK